jgi:hypothetical protein
MLTRCFNLQTRSGNEFSPWAPGARVRAIIVPLAAADFDFGHLIREAIVRESELDGDDTEGCALEAVTMPSSSRSLPIPSPPTMDAIASLPQSGTSCALASTPASQPFLLLDPLARDVPKYPHGSVENSLRKKRGHAKRAMQRMEQKRAAPLGDYAVKPAILNRHVRPATAIRSELKTKKLKHTKNAWTGARDKGGYRRVFTLDEMVGENSIFTFQLERWDGR